MPSSDRSTLEGLRGFLPSVDGAPTPVAQAFIDLRSALAAHAAALIRLDRAETRVIGAQGPVAGDEHTGPVGTSQPDDAAYGAPERPVGRSLHASPTGFIVEASGRGGGLSSSARLGSAASPDGSEMPLTIFFPRPSRGAERLRCEGGPPNAEAFPYVHLRRPLTRHRFHDARVT